MSSNRELCLLPFGHLLIVNKAPFPSLLLLLLLRLLLLGEREGGRGSARACVEEEEEEEGRCHLPSCGAGLAVSKNKHAKKNTHVAHIRDSSSRTHIKGAKCIAKNRNSLLVDDPIVPADVCPSTSLLIACGLYSEFALRKDENQRGTAPSF